MCHNSFEQCSKIVATVYDQCSVLQKKYLDRGKSEWQKLVELLMIEADRELQEIRHVCAKYHRKSVTASLLFAIGHNIAFMLPS